MIRYNEGFKLQNFLLKGLVLQITLSLMYILANETGGCFNPMLGMTLTTF